LHRQQQESGRKIGFALTLPFVRMEIGPMKKLMIAAAFVVICSGCSPDPKSGKGFSLPDGNIERGQTTFAQLQCNACHTVSGVKFDDGEIDSAETIVALGGEKTKVETYGDLVTSIINPSHRFAKGYETDQVAEDGQSKMRLYNAEMTVQQLIDLVAFLESHYSVIKYEPTPYYPY
jgi:mono/diheme cytochrome c family protein